MTRAEADLVLLAVHQAWPHLVIDPEAWWNAALCALDVDDALDALDAVHAAGQEPSPAALKAALRGDLTTPPDEALNRLAALRARLAKAS